VAQIIRCQSLTTRRADFCNELRQSVIQWNTCRGIVQVIAMHRLLHFAASSAGRMAAAPLLPVHIAKNQHDDKKEHEQTGQGQHGQ
jgi:hypothetical protein